MNLLGHHGFMETETVAGSYPLPLAICARAFVNAWRSDLASSQKTGLTRSPVRSEHADTAKRTVVLNFLPIVLSFSLSLFQFPF